MADPLEKRKTLAEKVDPEVQHRNERAERVITLMDRLGAEQAFSSPEARAAFLKNMSYEDLKRIGILTNDTLRGKGKSSDFDGAGVQVREVDSHGTNVSEYIPPDEEDKEPLLQKILESAKQLPNIEDAALLLAVGINAVHAFADGNGRAARLVLQLLGKGYDASPEAKEAVANILGPDGRNYLDPDTKHLLPAVKYMTEVAVGMERNNPRSPTEAWSDAGAMVGGLSVDTLPVPKGIDKEHRQKLVDIIEERTFTAPLFFSFLKEHDMLREPFIKFNDVPGRSQFNKPDQWTSIQIDEVLGALDQEQIQELLAKNRKIRKLGAEVLIRVFTQPDKFKMAGGQLMRDNFRQKALKQLA